MQIQDIATAASYDEKTFVAIPLLTAENGNVRLIKLAPGQVLPAHTHGVSDLFLYVVEGVGTLNDDQQLSAGTIIHLLGSEELRMANRGDEGLTLLAFLAPVFPPVG